MRVAVFHMRWMTRHLGFIARPFVRWYGAREIIACGLREEDGSVSLIYTPLPAHRAHRARIRDDSSAWRNAPFEVCENFSGSAVRRISLLDAREGGVYRMEGKNERGIALSSPHIYVKQTTVRAPDLLGIVSQDSITRFSWEGAEVHDPLIYFLAIHDGAGETVAAVYTRERFFEYPRTRSASYSLGPDPAPRLIAGRAYTALLALVDYDGWVSHLARQTFTVSASLRQ